MLHNPNWQKPTPEVFSTEGLVTWLEKQPSDEQYLYRDAKNCLICQYLIASGFPTVRVGATEMMWGSWYRYDECKPIPLDWNKIARGSGGPSTFGEAKERARKLLAAA